MMRQVEQFTQRRLSEAARLRNLGFVVQIGLHLQRAVVPGMDPVFTKETWRPAVTWLGCPAATTGSALV